MPYYRWRGVDIHANIQKGALFAQSCEHLADILLKKEIALLIAYPKNHYFIVRRITQADLSAFFNHLATLLEAKVHLSDALPLVIQQSDNPRFQNILYGIADLVNNGVPFHKALQAYPGYFSSLTLQMVAVGEQSGTMDLSCRATAIRMQEQSMLYNKIRTALLLPGITFVCFVVIAVIIFTTLIPRFATTFDSLKISLPHSTKVLISISSWFTFMSAAWLLGIVAILILLFFKIVRFNRCKLFLSYVALQIPFIGPIIHYQFCASFFQSLSILLEHTITLENALIVLYESEKNSFFKNEIMKIQKTVCAGMPLYNALSRSNLNLFDNTIIAMTTIGENSGNLIFMLHKITEFYTKAIQKRLHIVTTLIQPALMIILGLCIALLITLLYVPLFNLSLSVGNQ